MTSFKPILARDMRTLIQIYLVAHEIAIQKSTSYGTKIDDDF